MTCLLLTGWRTHGKDTVLEDLTHEHFHQNWIVLTKRNPDKAFLSWQGCAAWNHISFAKALKEYVEELYGLPPTTSKDAVLPFLVNGCSTYRELLVLEGENARQKDPYLWCKQAFFGPLKNKNWDSNPRPICVTDWRNFNELTFAQEWMKQNRPFSKVVTARVFRDKAVVPSEEEKTEHALDGFPTDCLILPRDGFHRAYNLALEHFPQYEEYI
jgi:hypothetical protein